MLKENMAKMLSNQVNKEYFSAYLYLSMSAYSDRLGFKGFSNWLHIQAKEEMAHGTHMYEHILERGAAPSLLPIEAPAKDFKGLVDVFTQTLAHEQFVTESINTIASAAMQEGDHATYNFLQWYINEQVEEEATADLVLQKLKFIGDNTGMIYNLDTDMGARVFVDPFPTTV